MLPSFRPDAYTHLIPSLERNLITTMDLLTLDALELAKRAQLPVLDVRNLVQAVRAQLRGTMGLGDDDHDGDDDTKRMKRQHGQPQRQDGLDLVNRWSMISTLDQGLDTVLGGGIPTGYVTEVTGERYIYIYVNIYIYIYMCSIYVYTYIHVSSCSSDSWIR